MNSCGMQVQMLKVQEPGTSQEFQSPEARNCKKCQISGLGKRLGRRLSFGIVIAILILWVFFFLIRVTKRYTTVNTYISGSVGGIKACDWQCNFKVNFKSIFFFLLFLQSPVKINQISLDESGEHMGVCSEDGKVQRTHLYI